MIRGNTSDFIDHPLPKDSTSAHEPLPSKFGAECNLLQILMIQQTQEWEAYVNVDQAVMLNVFSVNL